MSKLQAPTGRDVIEPAGSVECAGCDKSFLPEDVVAYLRYPDNTHAKACRYCISDWIRDILWPIPFWKRKVEEQELGIS